ncbi:MAG TPA: MoaD/ThiS family protein [Gemmatimonadaceae bacterium]
MTVTVRLFASYAQTLGRSAVDIETPEGATVEDVVAAILAMPGGDRLPPRPLVAVNHSYAARGTVIGEGDEVALIPPVAGG